MATCVNMVSVEVGGTTYALWVNGVKNEPYPLMTSSTGDPTSCGAVVLSSAEYVQFLELVTAGPSSSVYLTNSADAQEVGFALVGLLVVGFTIRALIRALSVADSSDEKH